MKLTDDVLEDIENIVEQNSAFILNGIPMDISKSCIDEGLYKLKIILKLASFMLDTISAEQGIQLRNPIEKAFSNAIRHARQTFAEVLFLRT